MLRGVFLLMAAACYRRAGIFTQALGRRYRSSPPNIQGARWLRRRSHLLPRTEDTYFRAERIRQLSSGTPKPALFCEPPASSLAGLARWHSPEGKVAVSVSGPSTLSYWDVGTGKNLKFFTSFTGVDRSVAFSRDGYRVLTGGDSAMTLWSRGKKKPLVTFFANKGGRSLAIASEGFFAGGRKLPA